MTLQENLAVGVPAGWCSLETLHHPCLCNLIYLISLSCIRSLYIWWNLVAHKPLSARHKRYYSFYLSGSKSGIRRRCHRFKPFNLLIITRIHYSRVGLLHLHSPGLSEEILALIRWISPYSLQKGILRSRYLIIYRHFLYYLERPLGSVVVFHWGVGVHDVGIHHVAGGGLLLLGDSHQLLVDVGVIYI